ncbi:MAG: C1 family peptidase [Clostridia bacterium]
MLSIIKKILKPKIITVGGWRPDPANKIYWKFERNKFSLTQSKIQYQSGKEIDLRPYTSSRHDQGSTSSCTANAVVKALEIKRIIKYGHANHVDLSRLDLYYGARERMTPPETNKDDGAYISLVCDILRDIGVCRESMHPFSKINLFKRPSIMATREARLNRIKSHFKIKSQGPELLDDIIFNLNAGNPVVFGTTVGQDWVNYKGGKEPLKVETKPIGNHAMVIIGFVDGLFVIENSWGTWGDDGFGYVDPKVFTHPSTRDLWVIVDGSEAWTEKK